MNAITMPPPPMQEAPARREERSAPRLTLVESSFSYEGRHEVRRVRLTAAEARPVRYVLAEWGGEAGLGSNFGAQLEKLAANPDLLQHLVEQGLIHGKPEEPPPMDDVAAFDEVVARALESTTRLSRPSRKKRKGEPKAKPKPSERWRLAMLRDAQTIHVKSATPTADVDAMLHSERWADKSTADQRFCRRPGNCDHRSHECDTMLRAWRALRAMAASRSSGLMVLHALYGDRPPGMPARGLWANEQLDDEYRRVARLTDAGGGSGAALDELARVDKKARRGESADAHKARVIAETASRNAALLRVGAEAEQLIEGATMAYRAAWRAA